MMIDPYLPELSLDSRELDSVRATFHQAAELVGLSSMVRERLERPKEPTIRTLALRRDDGRVTFHTAFRIRHSTICGPTGGGTRLAPDLTLGVVLALALTQMSKNALHCLHRGGAKGGVRIDPTELSDGEYLRLAGTYYRAFGSVIGCGLDYVAPDIGVNEEFMRTLVMAAEADGRNGRAMFAGKPVDLNGSPARKPATGHGVSATTLNAIRAGGLNPRQAATALMGSGNVALWTAVGLHRANVPIAAMTSRHGVFKPRRGNGIDIPELLAHIEGDGKLATFQGVKQTSSDYRDVIREPAAVLIPAATGSVIHEGNVGDVGAKIIVEGGNETITVAAEEEHWRRGGEVYPDLVANGAGAACSEIEIEEPGLSEQAALERIERRTSDLVDRVRTQARQQDVTMRVAAWGLGFERLRLDAMGQDEPFGLT